MPPKPRNNADDAHGTGKPDAKDKTNGADKTTATASVTTNGKPRRTNAATVAANAAAAAAAAAAQASAPATQDQTLQWTDFDRGMLHAYRRAYHLDTPGCFASEFSRWVLTQPGSVGQHSPTALRHRAMRRQSKAQLAGVARRHFNALGVQENDIVVDFLHKVQTSEVTRLRRPRRHGSNSREMREVNGYY